MGYPEWPTTADMTFPELSSSRIPHDYREYSFFQLVELLHQLKGRDPQDAQWELTGELQFSANPSLGFAPSDISMLESLGNGRLRLETCFLGLNGAQSPLPSYLLDMLLDDEEGIRRNFLDFFNNRLISLLYRLWRKYRYYVRFQENAADSFSAQVYALVGLANVDIRQDTSINWCKMLAYAGMLAGRSRSPQAVAGIVAHCFDLPNVSIRQWQLRQVEIPEFQRCRLGMANSKLGENTMLGKRIGDLCGKFVLCMEELSLERFRDFLPSGEEFQPLCKVMEVILREQMAYDLELTLRADEAPLLQLGEEKGGQLGWSSFLGKGGIARKSVLIQIRQ